MLEDVERLDQLINHLLDAAHIAKETKPVEKDTLQLDDILRQSATSAIARYAVPLETVQVTCPSITLHSQAVELDILFRNLIDNAVKYGGSPPQVTVTATELSGIVCRSRWLITAPVFHLICDERSLVVSSD